MSYVGPSTHFDKTMIKKILTWTSWILGAVAMLICILAVVLALTDLSPESPFKAPLQENRFVVVIIGLTIVDLEKCVHLKKIAEPVK